MMKHLVWISLVLLLVDGPAQAADPLSVEIGKSRMMRLSADPAIVMVADPAVADVVVEEGRVIFLVGLQAGETNVYILDDDGEVVMSRDLVVTPTTQRHVTVHRGVEEATMSCNPRCAGIPNPAAEGAVAPVNANQQAAAGAAGAATQLNPLAGLANQAAGAGQEGAGAADPAQLLQNLLSGGAPQAPAN